MFCIFWGGGEESPWFVCLFDFQEGVVRFVLRGLKRSLLASLVSFYRPLIGK